MNWSETQGKYIAILEKALDVRVRALDLCKISATNVADNLREALSQDFELLQKQLNRLKENEFRIAIVGLEKAGKSTFLNAWLENDLLPTDSVRCTFTTTQIYSVTNADAQKLEIKVKSPQAFSLLRNELEQATEKKDEAARHAKEDLESISKHKETLQKVIEDGSQTFPFVHLADIKTRLKRYVAEAAYAYAVNEARFYTTQLAATDGVVFFDVPGLDSGLGKHLEDSRAMLADCDAVICIQNSKQPSLKAHEQKLVDFIREGDQKISLATKLFVFSTRIDELNTPENFKRNQKEIIAEWQRRGSLPIDHIVFGSSAAFLILKGVESDEIRTSVGKDKQEIAEILRKVREDELETPESLSGIPSIKQRIKKYLEDERVDVLKERCDEPVRQLIKAAKEIYQRTSRHFPEDPDQAKKAQAARRNEQFKAWWKGRWERIHKEVLSFFTLHFELNNDDTSSSHKLKERYGQIVTKRIKQFKTLQQEYIDTIDVKDKRAGFDASSFNDEWRKDIYDVDIDAYLNDIAEQLSVEIVNDSKKFIEYMKQLLWNADNVATKMLDDEDAFRLELKYGLRALFLRFARPVAEAVIRGPLGSDRRANIKKRLKKDIFLLDEYYDPTEDGHQFNFLREYVDNGYPLLKSVSGENNPSFDKSDKNEAFPPQARTKEEVIREVHADIEIFQTYLLKAVFEAAGLSSFLTQELNKLRDEFVTLEEKQGVWQALTENEWAAQNPNLLNALPPELQTSEFNLEISEALRQLRISLENYD